MANIPGDRVCGIVYAIQINPETVVVDVDGVGTWSFGHYSAGIGPALAVALMEVGA